jgi:hypothetical protein
MGGKVRKWIKLHMKKTGLVETGQWFYVGLLYYFTTVCVEIFHILKWYYRRVKRENNQVAEDKPPHV